MGLIDAFLPKKYKNGKVLFEQNLDAWRLAAEAAFATINLNLTQIAKDSFLANYDFTNDGDPQTPKSLQQQILDLASGAIPLSGTTSDTWTINTDGNAATLSTFGLGADFTYTFPNASGELTVNTAAQILTNKTLTSPIINTPTINTATINSASFSGTVTSSTTFTYTIATPNSAIVINKTDVGAGDVIDITNAGIGHDIVGNAGNWFINPDGSATFDSLTVVNGITIGGFTPGSVLFAGVSGAISEDNANFFFDNTTNFFGLGTALPTYQFDSRSGTAPINHHIGFADNGMYLGSEATADAYISGGTVATTAGDFIARNAIGTILRLDSGDFIFYSNSGLTPGNSYTPTPVAAIANTGDIQLLNVDPPNPNAGNSNSFLKAWIEYIDDSGSVSNSFNVTSVTDDDGDGIYFVNWDTDFSTADYVVAGNSITPAPRILTTNSQNAGNSIVSIFTETGAAIDSSFSNWAAGDQ